MDGDWAGVGDAQHSPDDVLWTVWLALPGLAGAPCPRCGGEGTGRISCAAGTRALSCWSVCLFSGCKGPDRTGAGCLEAKAMPSGRLAGGRSPSELDSVGVPHMALGSGPTPRPAVPGDPQWRLVSRPRRMARGQQPGCPGAFWLGTWLEFPCPAPASSESPPRSALSGPGWEEGQHLSPSWEARPREPCPLWAQLGRLCGAAGGDRCV